MSPFLANHYTDWYWALIRKAQAEGRKKIRPYQYDRHHIIPKGLGGREEGNLVLLTRREHYVAHLLLIRMTEGSSRTKMVFSLLRLGPKSDGIRPYLAYMRWCETHQEEMRSISIKHIVAYNEAVARGEIKLTVGQIEARRRNGMNVGSSNGTLSDDIQRKRMGRRKETMQGRYTPEQLSEWSKRKKINPEAIRVTLKARYAAGNLPLTAKQLEVRRRPRTEAQKEKQSKAISGLVWIHRGASSKRIPSSEFTSHQESGWSKGRGRNYSLNRADRPQII